MHVLVLGLMYLDEWLKLMLDYQLQECKWFVPTFIYDGQQVLDELVLTLTWVTSQWPHMVCRCKLDVQQHRYQPRYWSDQHLATRLSTTNSRRWDPSRSDCYRYEDLHAQQHLWVGQSMLPPTAWHSSGHIIISHVGNYLRYFGYHELYTLIPKYGQYLLYFKQYIVTTSLSSQCSMVVQLGRRSKQT